MKSQDAMRQVFRDVLEDREELIDAAGNLAPASRIFPDYAAPIIRRSKGRDWTLTTARWGMPTPPVYLAGKRADPGVTNIRNVNSSHWRRWLGIEHRGLAVSPAGSVRWTIVCGVGQKAGGTDWP